MIKVLSDWYNRHFSNPQVAILAFLLLVGFAVIIYAGKILTPILAALVIAYILDGAVEFLQKYKIPRLVAVGLVFGLTLLILLIALVFMIPLLVKQTTQFVLAVPQMLTVGQNLVMLLPENYPNLVSQDMVSEILGNIRTQVSFYSQQVLSFSVASVFDVVAVLVYMVVVPLLVFFFLKDKRLIQEWFARFLPRDRALVKQVWIDVNTKIAGYMRGKLVEILVTWVSTFIVFLWFGLQYALLLSFVVGLSSLIPYVGAAIVTVPVALVAYFQWGFTPEFVWLMIWFLVVQILDSNLLVPLLFSEMVNLHPTAIISAVLVFGALWGFWGVFFAIPLATLIHAVLNAWPSLSRTMP